MRYVPVDWPYSLSLLKVPMLLTVLTKIYCKTSLMSQTAAYLATYMAFPSLFEHDVPREIGSSL